VGKEVETLTADGRKLRGTLTAADEQGFRLEVERKVKPEGEKRPRMVKEELAFGYEEIKYTKYLISFK
jgi:ribosome maturation factor RimP